ncbi:hypothetical protein EV697_10115 [Bisgaardia hudsonensis]|uniref:Uncharacterized protein n=1 Tax=Bisgaardia hudsonensis TaxID=109472 RepID=A0A4R2N265_9PAST|nr:DUF6882 domain-containing protein [Bisgaardia hudsonensis]QLB12373.1 hypothetical protein A6A11_01490 [Bisgaardia hudsonensis]TCP13899.1 hypothetical protein EV697_10115 [Bisgaardia hudsonensis]
MLFKKLFGVNLFSNQKSFSSLYDQYAILGFEKQLAFAESVEGLDWNINLDTGRIHFGEKLVFPVQVIGSFSFVEKIWLWAWANNTAKIPNKLLSEVKEIRAYGKKHKIDELIRVSASLSINDIHTFGLVIIGMMESHGYYIGNFGDGAVLVTVKNENNERHNLESVHTLILSTFPQFISKFKIKAQKKVLKHYLLAKKYRILEETDTHLIGSREGKEIVGIFDEKGRLLQLKG